MPLEVNKLSPEARAALERQQRLGLQTNIDTSLPSSNTENIYEYSYTSSASIDNYQLPSIVKELHLIEGVLVFSMILLYYRLKALNRKKLYWMLFAIGLPVTGFVISFINLIYSDSTGYIYYLIALYLLTPVFLLIISLFVPKKGTNRDLLGRMKVIISWFKKIALWFLKVTKFNLIKTRIKLLPTGYQRLLLVALIIVYPIFLSIVYLLVKDTEPEFDEDAFGVSMFFGSLLYYILIGASLWVIAGFRQPNAKKQKED